MLQLSRTVRFAVNSPSLRAEPRGSNGFAGSPPIRGLGRHYEMRIICAGDADQTTGYLIDIKEVDRVVRSALIPLIERACDENPAADASSLMPGLTAAALAALGPPFWSLRWSLSPYYSLEMAAAEPQTVLLRQRFDFSASHRLHVHGLSDEENRRRFGKCNNPSGHGHNYQFEPCVAVRPAARDGQPAFTLDTLERLAEQAIIQRFDHKNLSVDCPEFRNAPGEDGANATVENISRVFYEALRAAIKAQAPDVELRSITVWETDRTSATYPG